MTERFRDNDRAASYLSTGLINDFPNGIADVVYLHKAFSKRVRCRIMDIAPVLRRLCRKFPRVSVDYYPDNVDGVLALLRCHGEASEGNRGRNGRGEDHAHRPSVIVLLDRIGDEEVPSQATGILERVPNG